MGDEDEQGVAAMTACTKCGVPVHRDPHGSWVDATDGDGCPGHPDEADDGGVHEREGEQGMAAMNANQARTQGYDAGKAAGSWVIDGNTDVATAQRILDGWNEGDPEVLDMQPSPLSGEWAGESLNELGLGDADPEVLDAYEAGFSDGYWEVVQESAKFVVDSTDTE